MSSTLQLVYSLTVNWNRPDDTIACIDSLLAQVGIITKIIVVDNGSTDNSVSIIRSKYPQVELITCETNLKFGRGYNLGMRRALEAGAEYVFIINNDAIIAPNGLAALLKYESPNSGLLAPMIYYYEDPSRIWSMGGKTHSWTLEQSNDFRNTLDTWRWPPTIEKDFVTGCSMLFSRHLLEEVGLFDEGFEHYYEDMDLCRRIRLAGFKIVVVPQAKVWHKVARSSGGTDAPEERYWMAYSSVTFFRKHGRGWRMFVIIPYRLGSAIRTTFHLFFNGRLDSVKAYWRGLRDGLRNK